MFDFANSLPADALPATGPWTGLPAYNFVGGHNDEALIPVDELTDCVLAVMAAHGKRLATYGLGDCLLYTSPSPRDLSTSRMPSSA